MTTNGAVEHSFYDQVLEATPDGERLRLCLQCGDCSGICPFGYLMIHPPSRMIAHLRADRFEKVSGHRYRLDVRFLLCLYCSLPGSNPFNTRFDGSYKRRIDPGWQCSR